MEHVPSTAPADVRLVLILRDDLPANLASNAAVVLGLSLGGRMPDAVGPDGIDADGRRHPGLNVHPVPVLQADADQLSVLAEELAADPSCVAIDLTDVARTARDYGSYLATLSRTPSAATGRIATIAFGPRRRVRKLTKHLTLLGATSPTPDAATSAGARR